MGDQSAIEWTDATWNPLVGCSRVSEGCRHCYAERDAVRISGPGQKYEGVVRSTPHGPAWTGVVRLVEKDLDLPLRWKRPRRIFVNSMSDLFHEKVADEWIDRIFAAMALCPQHTFQVLTKRPERMASWFNRRGEPSDAVVAWQMGAMAAKHDRSDHRLVVHGHEIAASFRSGGWPLPNVWLVVSVEDQATANERIPLLLQTPAAVRGVSYEPALGPVDFTQYLWRRVPLSEVSGSALNDAPGAEHGRRLLDWLVVGGESGPGARPFDLAWARRTIAQCRAAGVPVFCKQLGSRPVMNEAEWHALDRQPLISPRSADPEVLAGKWVQLGLRDRKGGDMSEWPEDLRVREYPNAA